VKTSELIGPALDWAVAKCEDFDTRNNYRVWVTLDNEQVEFDCCADDWEHAYEQAMDMYPNGRVAATDQLAEYQPSTDWSQGGPIIEREIARLEDLGDEGWEACGFGFVAMGESPLIAAMRCLVASKLGDEVKIPEELL
jgi:hypothetical protein